MRVIGLFRSRDVVAHFPDLRDESLQPVEHLVEGGGQLVYLVAARANGDSFFQIAIRDLAGGQRDCLYARDCASRHEPADTRSQGYQADHGRDEYPAECVGDTRIGLHRLAHLEDHTAADRCVKNTHIVLAAWHDDGLKHRGTRANKRCYCLLADAYVPPVFHIGRGDCLARRVEEAKEYLPDARCLGLKHSKVLYPAKPPHGQHGGELAGMGQQLLVGTFADDRGDEHVEEKEGNAG